MFKHTMKLLSLHPENGKQNPVLFKSSNQNVFEEIKCIQRGNNF